ncbi:MAG TPA: ATP-binding protein [Actinomycetota bacterium]
MDRRPTLARRLVAWFALAVVGLLSLLGLVLDRAIERALLDDLTDSLVTQVRTVARSLEGEEDLQPEVLRLGRGVGLRITVIRGDGAVLADSQGEPAELENHADRPEVRAALAGEVGVDSRLSESVGRPFRYVALLEGERVVRVAMPLRAVQERLGRVRALIVLGASVAAVAGVVVVYLVARRLTRPLDQMSEALARMSAGDLEVGLPAGRTAELALLGETLDRLASDLGRRIAQIQEDRRMRDSILSVMDEGVVLVGGEDVRYVNPAARKLLHGTPTEVRGLAPHALQRHVREVRATGQISREEIETSDPPRIVQAEAVPVLGRDRVLLVLRDVTEQRRVEAMRRDFVADASHELKTPAASIQVAAETVRDVVEEDPRAAKRFAEQLHRDAVRLSTIVSDLLDLSRLEGERPEGRRQSLDRIAREEAERLEERAREAGVDLATDLGGASLTGDEEGLRLLVRNLVDNAIRHTGRGGRVRLAVRSVDGAVELTVADTGPGIPRREIPRIFERFYRVDRARSRETGGTGLGLAIVKHVVEQHGGRISVESELGRGSTFTVELPGRSE